MRFVYTTEHIEFLRKGYKVHRIPELTRRFNECFGLNKTEKQVKAALQNRKIHSGRRPGFKKGERKHYTDQQLDFLRDNYPKMDCAGLTAAFNAEFGTDKTPDQIHGTCSRYKIQSGRTGQFEKGQKSWNHDLAGKGVCKPNSGSFKKGDEPGNTRPMYSERVCPKDGFILIKVPVANPYTTAKSRFMHKHVWIWEQANGPVPDDHVIRFLDGDKTNCSLDNLGLFTRAESLQMSRLGFSDVPKELKPTVTAMAQLDTKVFEIERKRDGRLSGAEVEAKIMELGTLHQGAGKGAFSARQMQRAGWPEVKGYKAVKLGISMALQNLVKKGKLERVDRGLYALVDPECGVRSM